MKKVCLALALAISTASAPAVFAQPPSVAATAAPSADFTFRQRLAASDLRLTSDWMARSYEIPARVPQEMLLAGHSYADVLIALSMMGKGASLNELMELRAYHRWVEIAQKVELDVNALPAPIKALVGFSRDIPPAIPVLHFLPDVYSGLARDLTINAFTPVVPTQHMVERFRLNEDEVANIRRALDDPFGVPEELLREFAGRGGLQVGDWILAGSLAHHKPFSMEEMLAARSPVGNGGLSWSDICLAFGMRPDVLTQGPLSGIYPVLTGTSPGTVLVARRRSTFPATRPLYLDLERLTRDEVAALYPLMLRAYRVDPSEQRVLDESAQPLAEKGIAVALARLSRQELGNILGLRRAGNSWTNIIQRFAIDMTGQDGVMAAIRAREGLPDPKLHDDDDD